MSAPERIWATVNGMSTRLPDGGRQLIGGWSEDRDRPRAVEYVRADCVLAAPPADDPDLDATDFAHPAWWRGHAATVASMCQTITRILDGQDEGIGIAGEPWEGVRRRLMALTANREIIGYQARCIGLEGGGDSGWVNVDHAHALRLVGKPGISVRELTASPLAP